MIEDLKKDSARWRKEQDTRTRQGRAQGMLTVVDPLYTRSEEYLVSYPEMKGRIESEGYPDSMDVDMDDYPPSSRHRDLDARGVVSSGRDRHVTTPVGTGYAPEPGYPAGTYGLSSGRPSGYGPESAVPRTAYSGNATPPGGRSGDARYAEPVYPVRTTSATVPPMPAPASYRDPRTGQVISDYGAGGYPSERGGGRHR